MSEIAEPTDFYIGRGRKAEWLGSVAFGGNPQQLPKSLLQSSSENEYRKNLMRFFERLNQNHVFLPSEGWRWSWSNSAASYYSYYFDDNKLWACEGIHGWHEAVKVAEDLAIFERNGKWLKWKESFPLNLDKKYPLKIPNLDVYVTVYYQTKPGPAIYLHATPSFCHEYIFIDEENIADILACAKNEIFQKDPRCDLEYKTQLEFWGKKEVYNFDRNYGSSTLENHIGVDSLAKVSKSLKYLRNELDKLENVFGKTSSAGDAIRRFALACKAKYVELKLNDKYQKVSVQGSAKLIDKFLTKEGYEQIYFAQSKRTRN